MALWSIPNANTLTPTVTLTRVRVSVDYTKCGRGISSLLNNEQLHCHRPYLLDMIVQVYELVEDVGLFLRELDNLRYFIGNKIPTLSCKKHYFVLNGDCVLKKN